MSYFEQSVYAIEEFIVMRKKLNLFRQDKYFLALTAGSADSNFNGPSAPGSNKNGLQVLSSWEHPFKHL